MEVFFFWILMSVGVGFFATSKGKIGFLWFFLALIISPLIAGIILALMKDEHMEKKIENVERNTEYLKQEVGYNQKFNDNRSKEIERRINNINNKSIEPTPAQSTFDEYGRYKINNKSIEPTPAQSTFDEYGRYKINNKSIEAPTSVKHSTSVCIKCNNVNKVDSKFCSKCGSSMKIDCEYCDKKLDKDAVFCKNCGHKVLKEKKMC